MRGRGAEASSDTPDPRGAKLLRAKRDKWQMALGDVGPSEGAPVPFPRQARRDAASLVVRTFARPLGHRLRGGAGRQTFPPRGRVDPVFFPLRVHAPTVSASPVESPVGMIVSVLVQGYLPHGMLPAKHVPTVPAMMPSLEESEGFLADGRVADRGMGVWFPMAARGGTCDCGETGGQ